MRGRRKQIGDTRLNQASYHQLKQVIIKCSPQDTPAVAQGTGERSPLWQLGQVRPGGDAVVLQVLLQRVVAGPSKPLANLLGAQTPPSTDLSVFPY